MANYIHIQIRRDTSVNWESNNPVLLLGEIAADMTKHGLKVGDGIKAWTDLEWCSPELVNDLITGGTTKGLTAEQGKALKVMLDGKASITELTTLTEEVNRLKQQILTLQGAAVIFGMGYTVENFNGYGKPTRIKFSDGVTADLTWSGSRLEKITASTGEVMTMTYNVNGLITGRTVTQES